MTIPIETLVATILVEGGILWALTRQPKARVLLYSVAINAFTQPLASLVLQTTHASLWLIEGAVVLVESVFVLLLFRLKYGRAMLISLLADSATTLIGTLWFGWPR